VTLERKSPVVRLTKPPSAAPVRDATCCR